jgi:hypothetical protein
MRAIFISYRRQDSEGEAGRLFDDLVAHFGERTVFMDVATIQPGLDFRKAIDVNVSKCDVLLAMIGPGWLDARSDSEARRLDDPNDFVRIETAAALHRDIPVIPVLVRGAKMPRAEALPREIADLAYRNAVELTHARWKSDVQVLIAALRSLGTEPDTVIGAVRPAAHAQGPFAGHQASVPVPARGLDPAIVAAVTHDLAQFIGPIAEVVVSRLAAGRASELELRRAAAVEIDDAADRARFLARVRDL